MEKHLHGGHRQRLKARFLRDGIDGFEKHNMLELLLFYAIPQKDTNPIAHALLRRFGSLKNVFEASVEELCEVDGVSEHTATLIKLVPAVWRGAASETNNTETYCSLNKIARLLIKRFAGLTIETSLLVMLDSSYHIIDIAKLSEGSVNQASFDSRKLIELTLKANASMVVLAHNHPGGIAYPSEEDLTVTDRAAEALDTIKVTFLEHLVIAGGKYDALLSKGRACFWQKPDVEEFYDLELE